MFRALMSAYVTRLRQKPYTTNMCSSAIVMFSGDILAQCLAKDNVTALEGINWHRTFLMTAWSSLAFSPMWTRYFGVLDRFFGVKPTVKALIGKNLCTIGFMAPFTNLCFISAVTFFESALLKWERNEVFCFDEARQSAEKNLRDKFLKVWQSSAQFWVPVNTVNWLFMPTYARVVFSSVAAFFWNTYLSYVQHHPSDNDDDSNSGNTNSQLELPDAELQYHVGATNVLDRHPDVDRSSPSAV
ncbi:MAG: hypothetical protein MHM6MM_007645 [Cercozoa sp. M6MM]